MWGVTNPSASQVPPRRTGLSVVKVKHLQTDAAALTPLCVLLSLPGSGWRGHGTWSQPRWRAHDAGPRGAGHGWRTWRLHVPAGLWRTQQRLHEPGLVRPEHRGLRWRPGGVRREVGVHVKKVSDGGCPEQHSPQSNLFPVTHLTPEAPEVRPTSLRLPPPPLLPPLQQQPPPRRRLSPPSRRNKTRR